MCAAPPSFLRSPINYADRAELRQIITELVKEIAGDVNSEGQFKIEPGPRDVIFLGKRLACVARGELFFRPGR